MIIIGDRVGGVGGKYLQARRGKRRFKMRNWRTEDEEKSELE